MKSISTETLKSIAAVNLSESDFACGKAALRSRDFVPVGQPPGMDGLRGVYSSYQGVSPIAFWPATLDAKSNSGLRRRILDYPPGASVLLVPASAPRPGSDRIGEILQATLMTPISLAMDLVVTPVGIFYLTDGLGPGIVSRSQR
jgi:hypothetical protein